MEPKSSVLFQKIIHQRSLQHHPLFGKDANISPSVAKKQRNLQHRYLCNRPTNKEASFSAMLQQWHFILSDVFQKATIFDKECFISSFLMELTLTNSLVGVILPNQRLTAHWCNYRHIHAWHPVFAIITAPRDVIWRLLAPGHLHYLTSFVVWWSISTNWIIKFYKSA